MKIYKKKKLSNKLTGNNVVLLELFAKYLLDNNIVELCSFYRNSLKDDSFECPRALQVQEDQRFWILPFPYFSMRCNVYIVVRGHLKVVEENPIKVYHLWRTKEKICLYIHIIIYQIYYICNLMNFEYYY